VGGGYWAEMVVDHYAFGVDNGHHGDRFDAVTIVETFVSLSFNLLDHYLIASQRQSTGQDPGTRIASSRRKHRHQPSGRRIRKISTIQLLRDRPTSTHRSIRRAPLQKSRRQTSHYGHYGQKN
jgi:hypothetical protein